MHEVKVELGARAYPIVIGQGQKDALAKRLQREVGTRGAAVVADRTVLEHHGDFLGEALPDTPVIAAGPGEGTKSWDEFQRVSEALLAAGVGRDGAVVAFGGGVIGDLAGFCAATLRRGCRLVQVPTTLLSQVDSSVGGKTAINTRAGKNLVGAFHQPSLVLIDTAFLDTLPLRELRAGYAEVIKYALLGDAGFADWLEAEGGHVLARAPGPLAHAIAVCCQAKAAIVAADEREGGQRALLNLGHTFGHAVEAAYGYDGRVLHGEAVGLGMAMAYRYAARNGDCDPVDAARATALIAAGGLPVRASNLASGPLQADTFLAAMYQDKKVESGALTLVLPRGIGDAYVAKGVPGDRVRDFLEDELS